jgi:acyl carrier protein
MVRTLEFRPFVIAKKVGFEMDVHTEVLRVLDEVLSLNGRAGAFTRDTALLGAIPELDSMAVVSLITTLEEQLGIAVADDDIDGATFASVGSLVDFVSAQLGR